MRDRIHFIGSVDDDQLNNWIAASDFVVLPYLNTESGTKRLRPFALAVEIGQQCFFGSAAVFRAQDFIKSTSSFSFDSANPIELAYLIRNAERDKKHYESFVANFRSLYTAETQAATYIRLLNKND